MPRYRATVEYDGGPYKGFQLQKDQPSVQGELERAIHAFSGENARVATAGRTDRTGPPTRCATRSTPT